jgi:hypothetical protein
VVQPRAQPVVRHLVQLAVQPAVPLPDQPQAQPVVLPLSPHLAQQVVVRLSGYHYGPGSPTFRHRSHLDPLQPIGLMDMYKKEHAFVTPGQKRYIVCYFDYETASPEAVYDVLNSFLYSIICDCTFVVLGDCGRPCVRGKYSLGAKTWLNDFPQR